jgi:hypothetical protein
VLIAYQDLNGNGTLDVIPDGGSAVDNIVGVSDSANPSGPPPPRSHFVIYLNGSIAPADYWDYEALDQGYNLIASHYGYGLEWIPWDAGIAVPITGAAALNIYACPAAFQTLGAFQRGCGINPYAGRYQALGALDNGQGQFFVNNDLGYVANATITVDGSPTTYDPTFQSYGTSGGFTAGSHVASVSVPGFSPEQITAVVPDVVQVTAPTANQTLHSGAAVQIAWTAVSGANEYDVSFRAESGKVLFHQLTTALSTTTPPITASGPAAVRVVALGAQASGTEGSFIEPVSYSTHTQVTFGP